MKRLLLDTNIYGELMYEGDVDFLKKKIHELFVVHGFKLVRNELRDVSKKARLNGHNLRVGLLHLYDSVIKKEYTMSLEIEELAERYFVLYKELGGGQGKEKIFPDFLVVACASLHEINIVVSEDNSTMLSEIALKAYEEIHTLEKKHHPEFIGYVVFRRWLHE